jgi:class 3 adenylate cyclase
VLRGRDFLAYGAYLVALEAFQLSRTPLFPATHNNAWFGWLSFAALAFSGYWLLRTFLSLPATQPRLHRGFLILTCSLVAVALVAPWAPPWILKVVEFGTLAVLGVGAATLLVALRDGVRVARYFGIAYAGLFAGVFLWVLWRIAGTPAGGWWIVPAFGIELGSTFQALTLALGLADRIAAANEERDRAQRRTIEEMSSLNVAYARFVPRAFLDLLGKDDVRDVYLGDGVEREMTVLFSDVRSFTTISEALSPGATFGFINGLLSRTGPIVREHGGIVDKYLGDAIMALFPGSTDEALRAAIALQHAVAAHNLERDGSGAPVVVGVGLHRGSLMLGTIGESERMDGTVIADAVNVASRIEGLTKYFGAAIMVSESVRAALDDPENYAMRYLGRVAVKGKRHGIGVYEVLDGDPPQRRAAKVAQAGDFDAAVRAFVNGAFEQAATAFEALLACNPSDGAARYLQGRAIDLAASAVAWEGVDSAAK